MRPTGPMREASSNVSQHALEQRDYDTLPPAPQEQSLLSRVADTLRTFCPRVFGINEHFSQESALREPFFRAPDWTYTGSHACLDASIHMPTQGSLQALPVFSTLAAHDLYSCLRSHPRLSALFKSSHMQAHTLAYAHMPATSWYTIRIICLQRILFNIWSLLTSPSLTYATICAHPTAYASYGPSLTYATICAPV